MAIMSLNENWQKISTYYYCYQYCCCCPNTLWLCLGPWNEIIPTQISTFSFLVSGRGEILAQLLDSLVLVTGHCWFPVTLAAWLTPSGVS